MNKLFLTWDTLLLCGQEYILGKEIKDSHLIFQGSWQYISTTFNSNLWQVIPLL